VALPIDSTPPLGGGSARAVDLRPSRIFLQFYSGDNAQWLVATYTKRYSFLSITLNIEPAFSKYARWPAR
jgi:hypothetical protein